MVAPQKRILREAKMPAYTCGLDKSALADRTAFWDTLAATHDAYFSRKRLEAIARFLQERVGARNLDLGGGLHSYLLGSVGLDISEASIAKLPEKSRAVVFDLCDVGRETDKTRISLPFADCSFDSASAIGLWPYLERKTGISVLKDLERVLVPGGMVYVVDSNLHFSWQVRSDTSPHRIARNIQKAGYEAGVENVDFLSGHPSYPIIQAVCVKMPSKPVS